MKRLKAIFSAIRTLGRTPTLDIAAAWEQVQQDLIPASHNIAGGASSLADRHLIAQCIFGVQDEAEAWLKKLGEQAETTAEDAK